MNSKLSHQIPRRGKKLDLFALKFEIRKLEIRRRIAARHKRLRLMQRIESARIGSHPTSPFTTSAQNSDSTRELGWSTRQDDRRCELIDQEMSGSLRADEAEELKSLQQAMLDYRRSVAPLPVEAARKLRNELLSDLASERE